MRIALRLLAILALSSAGTAQMGILGTAHDFSDLEWNIQKPQQICGVCHIPHDETVPSQTSNKLIWSRSLEQQSDYTLYRSRTLIGDMGQPDGTTRLCLGCHDGSVALEHSGKDRPTGSSLVTRKVKTVGLVNRDLSNDHPISIVYLAGGRTNLRPRSSPFSSGTILDVLEETPPDSGIFKVQCITCHDVHNRDVQPGAEYLLRIRNDVRGNPSALCFACHDR